MIALQTLTRSCSPTLSKNKTSTVVNAPLATLIELSEQTHLEESNRCSITRPCQENRTKLAHRFYLRNCAGMQMQPLGAANARQTCGVGFQDAGCPLCGVLEYFLVPNPITRRLRSSRRCICV